MIYLRLRLHIALALLVLLGASLSQGQATATLSADVVSEFESVTLTVTDQSRDPSDPDFSSLENDFEISHVSTNSMVNIVNGRVDSSKKWQLELMPKRTGTIDIAPIAVGSYRTNGLRLLVNAISARERDYISKTALFETIVTPQQQYPQAAIYVTRRMLYTSQARIPSMPQDKQLDIADATVLPLGSRETLREVRNGIEYYVMQWRYVVFAEKSGTLRIPGESARVAIYGNQFRPQIRPIVAPEKSITILPIPEAYPRNEPWFPASKVELTQLFDPSNTATLNLGDALTRTINVRARDSYQSALLPLELGSIEDLRVYPEQASVDSVLDGDRVWGTQSRAFNLIPVDPGSVAIPEFRLTWWDTEAREVKVATLPSATFNVPDPRGSQFTAGELQSSDASADAPNVDLESAARGIRPWVYALAIAAVTGWILAFILLYFNKDSLVQRFGRKTLRSRIDFTPIRHALAHSDISALRHAILHTIARHLGIDLVAARELLLGSSDGHALLSELDQLAFSNATREFSYDFKTIQQVIDLIVKNYSSKPQEFGLQAVLN